MRRDDSNQSQQGSTVLFEAERSALIDTLVNHFGFPPTTAVAVVQRAARLVEKVPGFLLKSKSFGSGLLARAVAGIAHVTLKQLHAALRSESTSPSPTQEKRRKIASLLSALKKPPEPLPEDPDKLKALYLSKLGLDCTAKSAMQELEQRRRDLLQPLEGFALKRKALKDAVKEGRPLPGTRWKTVSWEPRKQIPVCDLVPLSSYYTLGERRALPHIEDLEVRISALKIVQAGIA